jgi:hypothetical protein
MIILLYFFGFEIEKASLIKSSNERVASLRVPKDI